MAQMGPSAAETMRQSPLNQAYPNVNWAVLFTKLGDLLKKDYDWSKEVAAIKAPTMIVFADADAVPPAHTSWSSSACSVAASRRFRWFWKACGPARRFARPYTLQH